MLSSKDTYSNDNHHPCLCVCERERLFEKNVIESQKVNPCSGESDSPTHRERNELISCRIKLFTYGEISLPYFFTCGCCRPHPRKSRQMEETSSQGHDPVLKGKKEVIRELGVKQHGMIKKTNLSPNDSLSFYLPTPCNICQPLLSDPLGRSQGRAL